MANQKHKYPINKNKRLWRIYSGMKSRCNNSKATRYKNYGGRGINVCFEWENSFDAFAEWAYENGYRDELTIERIDVDSGYSPTNCKWAEKGEQAYNKRNTIYVECDGEKMCLAKACKQKNLPYSKVRTLMIKHDLQFSDVASMVIIENAPMLFGNEHFVSGVCAYCGTWFNPKNSAQKYCSGVCREKKNGTIGKRGYLANRQV